RVTKRTFADGYEISYSYDILDRIEKVEGTDGRTVSYEYDAMGRATKVTDGESVTFYTYTRTGRLKSVVDALGNETAYTYDSLDNLKSIHRAEGLVSLEESTGEIFPTVGKDGHVTVYDYNLSGQLTEVTDALGQKEHYEYDHYGRLISKTDKDDYKTTYSYNINNQVNAIKYADGRSVALSYDALGRLEKFNDWLGATEIERDILGRAISIIDYNGKKVSYTYGKTDERTSITYPSGKRVDYIYDDKLNLTELINGNEKTRYTYDELDRLIEKYLPNANREVMDYLPGGFLKSLEMYDNNGLLDKYVYRYDSQGNRTEIDRLRRNLDEISGRYSYRYDQEKRLTSVSLNGELLRSYGYDAFGNRSSMSENGNTTIYSYDELDRLLEETNSIEKKTYSYDKRGNIAEKRINDVLEKTFTYDATNMLTRVDDVSKGEALYSYNGLGKRVSVVNPTERIEYLLDLTKDYHNMLERSVNGEVETYTYDSNVVSMSKEGQDYFYMHDELGTCMYLTGTDGIAVSSYAYDEFGRNLNPFTGKKEKPRYTKQGNIIQPLAFTGYQHDEMTDGYYAQARYYDARVGRFISRDKAKFILKSVPITHNIYTYCGNNTIMNIDPDGHESIVLSGGPADGDDFGYQFIETAIKDMRDQIASGTDPEDVTWIVMDVGYSKTDISNFNDTASKLGVNIVVADGKEDLINYINDKNGGRSTDAITRASFYCHGRTPRRTDVNENELSFAYDIKDVDQSKFSFTQSDIGKLDANAFDNTVTYFYSCNSGTNDNSNTSFAQEWSNKTGGRSLGLKNARTVYAFINTTGDYGFYTGELGHKAMSPSDYWNYFKSLIGKPSTIWMEKQKRHDRNDENGKHYSEFGCLQYPWMVSLAGDLDGLEDTFDRGWVWFEPECEG
ncbi:RHS repeat-associated core domain-containing protein, partial [Butyrivibrio sp. INlla21]|uniref:RHS repeat-associated core domain-containing protein n=1 Tax=Butyrivibrio sp. INlla21 TaxID=1520811 RepID=UPI0008ED3AD3